MKNRAFAIISFGALLIFGIFIYWSTGGGISGATTHYYAPFAGSLTVLFGFIAILLIYYSTKVIHNDMAAYRKATVLMGILFAISVSRYYFYEQFAPSGMLTLITGSLLIYLLIKPKILS